jgi:hypothetical protein
MGDPKLLPKQYILKLISHICIVSCLEYLSKFNSLIFKCPISMARGLNAETTV